MLYYFLTIDKCDTSGSTPTKEDYLTILNIWVKHKGLVFGKLPVECFEIKKKIVMGNQIDWLHYHGIVSAKKMIVFKDMQVRGYSVKFQYLKTKKDIFNTAAYINKDKKDGYIYNDINDTLQILRQNISNEACIDTGC